MEAEGPAHFGQYREDHRGLEVKSADRPANIENEEDNVNEEHNDCTGTVMSSGLVALVNRLASTGADMPAATQQWVVKNPTDLDWKLKETLPQTPSPAHVAVAWGDPAKGAYAFFGKFPAGFTVPMHWHTNEVLVVMTKSSMVITPEGGVPREIQEGGYFSLPAKMKYTARCAQECVFLAWGERPFDILYQNPNDDPRNSTAEK